MREARGTPRGQALTELVVVLPVIVPMIFFSLLLTELARAQLKLLEVSRFAAWELTAFSLSDFSVESAGDPGPVEGAAAHAQLFALAGAEVQSLLAQRYGEWDALESRRPFSAFVALSAPELTLGSKSAHWTASRVLPPSDSGSDARPGQAVAGMDSELLARRWGFNVQGAVQVHLSTALRSKALSEKLSQRASADFSLVVDDWHSPDGMDSNMVPGRAGRHSGNGGRGPGEDSLLYRQVSRMKFLGLADESPLSPLNLRGWPLVSVFIRFPTPAFRGTFVVSHGYRDNVASAQTRGCDGVSHDVKHPAFSGLNNLDPARNDAAQYGPGAEPLHLGAQGELRCFDTTPFRDTQSYDGTSREDGSLFIQIFKHRGNHFMGCKNAMADDVSRSGSSNLTDEHTDTVTCE